MQPEIVERLPVPVEQDEPAGMPSLFGTTDPHRALVRMAELADALVDVVRQKKLATQIRGREYLNVEAWQCLGGLVGVFASIAWTRPNETGDGYVARAEARTLRGELVGAAEAECSRVEQTWKSRDPFTLRSMAQTRAMSRALRAPLAAIAALAGFEATAVEEMTTPDVEVVSAEPRSAPAPTSSPADPVAVTDEQKATIMEIIRALQERDPETDWQAYCREEAGVSWRELTQAGAEMLIRRLRERLAEGGDA